jgi:hypothetical protein
MNMKAVELIHSGRKLLSGDPSEADCRRAISSAYYALFYQLCEMSSRSLTGIQDERFSRVRYQVFRSLTHKNAYDRCRDCKNLDNGFPVQIQEFADVFIYLQEQREFADYCCERKYSVATANDYLEQAELVLTKLGNVSVDHQRAFSLFILLSPNKHSKKIKVT